MINVNDVLVQISDNIDVSIHQFAAGEKVSKLIYTGEKTDVPINLLFREVYDVDQNSPDEISILLEEKDENSSL